MYARCVLALACVTLAVIALEWNGSAPPSPTIGPTSIPRPRSNSALDRTIPNLNFENTPLETVIRYLSAESRANIVVQWEQIRSDVRPDTPVTVHLRNVSLAKALDLVCELVSDHDANGTVRPLTYGETAGGIIEVSAGDLDGLSEITEVFDISDLIALEDRARSSLPLSRGPMISPYYDSNDDYPLVKVLRRVNPSSLAMICGKLLIVSAGPPQLRAVRDILEGIRHPIDPTLPLPEIVSAGTNGGSWTVASRVYDVTQLIEHPERWYGPSDADQSSPYFYQLQLGEGLRNIIAPDDRSFVSFWQNRLLIRDTPENLAIRAAKLAKVLAQKTPADAADN